MESISTQYSGRSGRQIVVTDEGVEDELKVRREGWEVVVSENAADYRNFHWIITLLLAFFSNDYFHVIFLRRALAFLYMFVMRMRNCNNSLPPTPSWALIDCIQLLR